MLNIKLPQKVPTVLGMLNELQVLIIYNVNFGGNLYSELFRLHQLKQMIVISSLEGTLPSEMSELRSLEYLELRENNFDGQIPTELGLLQNLTDLDISVHDILRKLRYLPRSVTCHRLRRYTCHVMVCVVLFHLSCLVWFLLKN